MAGLSSQNVLTTRSAAGACRFQCNAHSTTHSRKAAVLQRSSVSLRLSIRPPAHWRACAAQGSKGELPVQPSIKDEEAVAYRYIDGRKFYLDELDVISLLDGFAYLKPFDPSSYNAAAYIWYMRCIVGVPNIARKFTADLVWPSPLVAW